MIEKNTIDINNSFSVTVVVSTKMLYLVRFKKDRKLFITTIFFEVKYLNFYSFTLCLNIFTINT